MKWSEGAYFAAWMNMLGNDERIDILHSGSYPDATLALKSLREEYRKFQENEEMNNHQERS